MLRKLYKHEMLSYLRQWLPIEIIVLGTALIGRIVQFFESNSSVYETIFSSTLILYIISIVVSLVLTFVVCIKRFHNNLFAGEGYLTLTLPVTPAQHILIKAAASATVELSTAFIALLSIGVFTAGEVYSEILKAVGYLFKTAYGTVGFHLIIFILEAAILLTVSLVSGSLLIYACIALGQTFSKNRTGKAAGVFFLYYFLSQIIASVFSTVISEFANTSLYFTIGSYFVKQPQNAFHAVFGITLLWNLITGAVFFIITHHVLNKKLNLE